jgi:hypothetical protein
MIDAAHRRALAEKDIMSINRELTNEERRQLELATAI